MDIELLKGIAYIQGAFVVGVNGTIIFFYLKYVKNSLRKYLALLISASYILLVAATIISIDRTVYEWGDVWFHITGIAYLLGDVGFCLMLKYITRLYFGLIKDDNHEN